MEGDKKLESQEKLSHYPIIAVELIDLLEKVCGVEVYIVTDKSSLNDFSSEKGLERIWSAIKNKFGVDVSNIESRNLVDICKEIEFLQQLSN